MHTCCRTGKFILRAGCEFRALECASAEGPHLTRAWRDLVEDLPGPGADGLAAALVGGPRPRLGLVVGHHGSVDHSLRRGSFCSSIPLTAPIYHESCGVRASALRLRAALRSAFVAPLTSGRGLGLGRTHTHCGAHAGTLTKRSCSKHPRTLSQVPDTAEA